MTIGPTNGRDGFGRHAARSAATLRSPPMARKDRVPNPPKRPQAPQRRSHARRTQRTPSSGGACSTRSRRRGCVALAPVLAIVFFSRWRTAAGASGLRSRRPAARSRASRRRERADHSDVPTLDDEAEVELLPPTSGPHYASAAPSGARTTSRCRSRSRAQPRARRRVHPLRPRRAGGRVEADARAGTTSDDPNGLVVAPLPSLGDKIALGAGRRRTPAEPGATTEQRLPREVHAFDEDAFSAFIDEYRFQGPGAVRPLDC